MVYCLMSLTGLFPVNSYSFKRRSILEGLPSSDIALLTSDSKTVKYKKNEILFTEGEPAKCIYLILSGRVKKFKKTCHDREQIFYMASSGELIGFHALFSDGIFQDSASTIDECSICIISLKSFQAVLKKSPDLNGRLLHSMSHEYNVLMNLIMMLSTKSTRERLAIHLLLLYNNQGAELQSNGNYQINISRDILASLVGTVRENIVRLLAEFIELGLIKKEGRKLEIINLPQLIRLANCS